MVKKVVTVQEYREMALALPEAIESSHMNHPDFRVRGRIFATIRRPEQGEAVVILTPAQQKVFVEENLTSFAPVRGGWGERGATSIQLAQANLAKVRSALECAWRNVAPKKLIANFDQ
jgi:hypothetical protein